MIKGWSGRTLCLLLCDVGVSTGGVEVVSGGAGDGNAGEDDGAAEHGGSVEVRGVNYGMERDGGEDEEGREGSIS
jgi:hypothetical protein